MMPLTVVGQIKCSCAGIACQKRTDFIFIDCDANRQRTNKISVFKVHLNTCHSGSQIIASPLQFVKRFQLNWPTGRNRDEWEIVVARPAGPPVGMTTLAGNTLQPCAVPPSNVSTCPSVIPNVMDGNASASNAARSKPKRPMFMAGAQLSKANFLIRSSTETVARMIPLAWPQVNDFSP